MKEFNREIFLLRLNRTLNELESALECVFEVRNKDSMLSHLYETIKLDKSIDIILELISHYNRR